MALAKPTVIVMATSSPWAAATLQGAGVRWRSRNLRGALARQMPVARRAAGGASRLPRHFVVRAYREAEKEKVQDWRFKQMMDLAHTYFVGERSCQDAEKG